MTVPYRVAQAPHTSPAINPKPHLLSKCYPETELKMEFGAILRFEYKLGPTNSCTAAG